MTTVWIMRGLPGSGKSTFIKQNHPKAKVFSADDYPGRYDKPFDPRKIGLAHPWVYKKFLDCLRWLPLDQPITFSEMPDALVIDNTNLTAWECAPYVLAASAYGLECQIVTILCDPIVAWRRNVHEVPLEVVMRMDRTMRDAEFPPFWRHTYAPVNYPEK